MQEESIPEEQREESPSPRFLSPWRGEGGDQLRPKNSKK